MSAGASEDIIRGLERVLATRITSDAVLDKLYGDNRIPRSFRDKSQTIMDQQQNVLEAKCPLELRPVSNKQRPRNGQRKV
ncbi:hypothetical protein GNI_172770 [Gregarina niphandrodes]|uniref:Uncharacterized protein n=1 Tax=Gregarina niphandrodes TaxID=110365 RepID=A0A023AXP4_GRENI|nr:hypothetical protein GNI_172770 [Gregarina niphandrodes]EZG43422.1 hypothetical protein GNI_172770 [Gregarina niphandrodes]|eukprot:XP_011133342.1 hypothetical protein GNI_172770 [Gregarina niphandrodes]